MEARSILFHYQQREERFEITTAGPPLVKKLSQNFEKIIQILYFSVGD